MENNFLNAAGVAHLWKRITENFVSKDGDFSVSDNVVEGYYYNENFYEDADFKNKIVGSSEKIYIDLKGNRLCRYDAGTDAYILLTSSGDGSGTGMDGVGIHHITYNSEDFTLTIYLDDGTEYKTGSLRGVQGEQGVQGESGLNGNIFHITDSDDAAFLTSSPQSEWEILEGSGFDVTTIRAGDFILNSKTQKLYNVDNISNNIITLSYLFDIKGKQGDRGITGGFYTPSVSDDGNLSWIPSDTNNMPDIGSTNIKGVRGDAGLSAYEIAKENGFGGTETEWLESLKGEEGNVGTTFTPTISENGELSWTNNGGLDNPAPVSIKGEQGVSVTIADVKESSDDDGVNTIVFSDGTQLNIKNGSKGSTGQNGSNYNLTESDKAEIAENIEASLIDNIGVTFNKFPSEEEIRALPNNSFFAVKMYRNVYNDTDGDGTNDELVNTSLDVIYHKSPYPIPNALLYVDENGVEDKFYVTPIGQPMGELYLPYYGIKTGIGNAESNSDIMDRLTYQKNGYGASYGSTFKLPAGNYYFSKPINLVNKHNNPNSENHYSFVGTINTNHKNYAKNGVTFLHFINLSENEAAMKIAQCTLENLVICGTPEQYNMVVDREKAKTNMDEVFSETINVKACGVEATGSVIIRNVGFKNFYYGCWCGAGNTFISDISFHDCHCGLSIYHDIKVYNIFGAEVMVLLQMRGSISSAVGVRGDSIGEHLVEILHGYSHTLADLDADFCMGSIVAIGDGENNCEVNGVNITGIHGRAGVKHMYLASGDKITANDIASGTSGEYGVISVKAKSSLKGSIITTNQYPNQNPFDETSGYYLPFILLSADMDTIVEDVQIFSIAYNIDELTEDWTKEVVSSLSNLPNACFVKIQTSKGSMIYKKGLSSAVVISDVADIYQRMDKSELALNGEVIKTINGLYPDENGNVEILDIEPEVVSSSDEFEDITKKYVLDGYIYVNRAIFVEGGIKPLYTNQLPLSLNPLNPEERFNDNKGYKENVYYCLDSGEITEFSESKYEDADGNIHVETLDDRWTTGFIPVKKGQTVRINSMGYTTWSGLPFCHLHALSKDGVRKCYHIRGSNNGWQQIVNGGGKCTTNGQVTPNATLNDVELIINSTLAWDINDLNDDSMYIQFLINPNTQPEDVIITVEQPIVDEVVPDHFERVWVNTGKKYIETDYSEIIKSLEERIVALEGAVNTQD